MNKSSKRHESLSKSSNRSSKRNKSHSTSDRSSKRRTSLSEEFDRLQFLQSAKDISRMCVFSYERRSKKSPNCENSFERLFIEDFTIYHEQKGYDETELQNFASKVWKSLPRHEQKKYKDMIKVMRGKKDQLEADNQFDEGHKESPVEKGGRGKGKKKHRRGKGKRGGGKGKGKA